MLVVMEDRDLHLFLEPVFDLETLRGRDVLEVDASKGRLQQLHAADEFLGVAGVDLEIKNIDVCEAFEEDRFPLHHRFSRRRPDVAQAENRGAVRDHRDKISLVCVFVDVVRLAGDLQAGFGHTGCVGKGQVALRCRWFGGDDFGFSGTTARVVFQSVIALVIGHWMGLRDSPRCAVAIAAGESITRMICCFGRENEATSQTA